VGDRHCFRRISRRGMTWNKDKRKGRQYFSQ
jgi:hypothetical protein